MSGALRASGDEAEAAANGSKKVALQGGPIAVVLYGVQVLVTSPARR